MRDIRLDSIVRVEGMRCNGFFDGKYPITYGCGYKTRCGHYVAGTIDTDYVLYDGDWLKEEEFRSRKREDIIDKL